MAGQFDLKWQPVQASDASRLLAVSQEATEAYDKAVKDQIKVFDTMFNNAQQHKMNEVQQAVNAFSLEDYNAPDARAKFDEIVANASQGIGGLNAANQLTMDTIWDKRGDVLSDRATAQFNLNEAERKDTAAKDKEFIDDAVGKFATAGALVQQAKTDEERATYSGQQRQILEDVLSRGDEYYTQFQTAYEAFEIDRLKRQGNKETAEDDYAKSQGSNFARQVDALETSQAGLDAEYKAGKLPEKDYLAQSQTLAEQRQVINSVLSFNPRVAGHFSVAMEETLNKRAAELRTQQKHTSDIKLANARAYALKEGVSIEQAKVQLKAQEQQHDQQIQASQSAAQAVQGSIDDKVNAIMGAMGKSWEGARGEIKMLFNEAGKIDPSLALKDLQTRVKRVANAEANATNQVQGTFRDWWQGKEGQALAKQFKDKKDVAAMNNALEYINSNNNNNINFTTQEKIAFMKAVASKELASFSTGNDRGWFDTGRGWLNNNFAHSAASNWLANYRTQEREKKRIANQRDIALYMEQTGAYIDGGWDSIISANPKTFSDTNMQIYARGKNITSGSSSVTMSPNGAPQGHPAYHPSNNGGSTSSTPPNSSAVGYIGSKVVTQNGALPIVGALVDGANWVKGLFD